MYRQLFFKLLIFIAISPALQVLGDEVIKQTSLGRINWTQGVVYADGFGTARAGVSGPQKRLLAQRAATVDAQRNLLEITRGVRIDSELKTDQAMQQSRETTAAVEGIVKGARITRKLYQNEVATVTLAMPIAGRFLKVLCQADRTARFEPQPPDPGQEMMQFLIGVSGDFLDALIPFAQAGDAILIRDESELQAYLKLLEWMQRENGAPVDKMLQQAISDYETNSLFSGLLIDASSVADFELATIPKIRDQEGNIIYPSEQTSYDDIVNKRGVSYDFDLSDAIKNKRVATSPFIIKALSTYKNLASDLIITTEDAQRVRSSNSTVAAMNKAGVLIVVAI